MRLAISRRIDRALNFSASWIGRKSAESIRSTQRGRLSLPGDEGLVTSICLAVAIPVAAIGAVVVCSANAGSLVLLRRFPRSDGCPPAERRTYVGEPLRRLARDTAAKTFMRQKRFGCGRSTRQVPLCPLFCKRWRFFIRSSALPSAGKRP